MPGALRNKTLYALVVFLAITSCRGKEVPKPRGFFRIDFPEKRYMIFDSDCPFNFEYPVYGKISNDVADNTKPCWFNIEFPGYKSVIHMSYLPVNNNLAGLLRESNEFVYSHTVRADAITEQPYRDTVNRVYCMLYDIKGNAASSVQFTATDSTGHFLRGALYFYSQPREDSLAPAIQFFREDIVHLIETLRWKPGI
ncbi:MAG: gliding motility lipoprotein GldD [Bacteroidales bacterium]|nr:gliding motility lipoprotein GldD [Bacteroidales bacterium]